jgi:hypothetical protein
MMGTHYFNPMAEDGIGGESEIGYSIDAQKML